jgi:hypothetical protein
MTIDRSRLKINSIADADSKLFELKLGSHQDIFDEIVIAR